MLTGLRAFGGTDERHCFNTVGSFLYKDFRFLPINTVLGQKLGNLSDLRVIHYSGLSRTGFDAGTTPDAKIRCGDLGIIIADRSGRANRYARHALCTQVCIDRRRNARKYTLLLVGKMAGGLWRSDILGLANCQSFFTDGFTESPGLF